MSAIRYVSDESFCWMRQRHGNGFRYLTLDGDSLKADEVDRIKKLGIPPAWVKVKVCQNENGHIQAVGFDAKGRKQYIYHPAWAQKNQEHKFDKMVRFGEVLPTLRETMAGHMRQHTLTQERVLATIVWLLEHTFIRVGNKEYAEENHSYGLTTMREKHVTVEGNTVNFSFKGKSGIYHEVDISNPRVAKTIRQCLELPGYELFQYLDEAGERQSVDSQAVNEYLQAITGEELSAKDFRTWGGTTLAGDTLYKLGSPESKTAAEDAIRKAVKNVSQHLRNTATVCRKYYIHPVIVKSYEKDELVPHFKRYYGRPSVSNGLSTEERATWTLLKSA
jgi:DNA topoisomerase I